MLIFCQNFFSKLFAEVGHNEDAVIGGPCQAEMTAHRKMLMEDYNISPELVNACNEDIENNCKILGKKGNNPGEVIHCLMRAVMEQKVTDQKVRISIFCENFRESDFEKKPV